jgi:hypothetical protein
LAFKNAVGATPRKNANLYRLEFCPSFVCNNLERFLFPAVYRVKFGGNRHKLEDGSGSNYSTGAIAGDRQTVRADRNLYARAARSAHLLEGGRLVPKIGFYTPHNYLSLRFAERKGSVVWIAKAEHEIACVT